MLFPHDCTAIVEPAKCSRNPPFTLQGNTVDASIGERVANLQNIFLGNACCVRHEEPAGLFTTLYKGSNQLPHAYGRKQGQ